jgi:hypothetical protein
MRQADPPEWPRNETRHKPGPGRGHKWEPTKVERFKACIAFGSGATQATVAQMLGVSKDAVQKRLDKEFRFGREISNEVLRQRLWRKAIKEGDTAALIFLAKNQLGMTDRREVNNTGDIPPPREEFNLRVVYVLPGGDPRAELGPPQALLEAPKEPAEAR